MSKRLQPVEIEGFGLTLRSLTKGQIERVRDARDPGEFALAVLKRGLVSPHWASDEAAPILTDPKVMPRVVQAIVDRSWPGVEV